MDIKLKYRAYVGEKHPDITSKLIDSDIERFAIEFSEHLLEQLCQYNVVGRSEQFYCVSSNALVYGKPCEKWCGDENCKALCKQ